MGQALAALAGAVLIVVMVHLVRARRPAADPALAMLSLFGSIFVVLVAIIVITHWLGWI